MMLHPCQQLSDHTGRPTVWRSWPRVVLPGLTRKNWSVLVLCSRSQDHCLSMNHHSTPRPPPPLILNCVFHFLCFFIFSDRFSKLGLIFSASPSCRPPPSFSLTLHYLSFPHVYAPLSVCLTPCDPSVIFSILQFHPLSSSPPSGVTQFQTDSPPGSCLPAMTFVRWGGDRQTAGFLNYVNIDIENIDWV